MSPEPRYRPRRRLLLVLALSLTLPLACGLGQEPEAPPEETAPAAPAEQSKTLLDVFQSGGPLMFPLLLCSVGTVAVAAYCFVQINGRKMIPKAQADAVASHLQNQDANNAYLLCHGSPNVFANTMAAALLKVNFERELCNKVSMEQAAAETLADEETKLMIWVNYLNVFATIGPMLGLLGTVTGMITSFDQLAAGRSEPQDLAGGIGEAMTTTATGLVVGIPAMFFYFYFKNLLSVLISTIQKRVTFMIDLLSGELKLQSAAAEYEETEAPADAGEAATAPAEA